MTDQSAKDLEQPFISHLMELRDRLLRMVLVVLVIFVVLFPFGNDIYRFIAEPLMAVLPEGTSMIATQVASPFLTPFKLSLVAAVFLAMPHILYQFWGFIAPGLYQHERKLAMPLLVSSIALFYLGMLFAFYVVFPLVFSFLTGMAPEGVAVMTDITAYLDFVLTLFFAFGIAFEVPIATILLVWMGMTTPEKLAGKRPYVIVGAFVIGMLLTPPDVISQTLLAFPMWVLFELGIIFSRFFVRKSADQEDEAEEAGGEANASGDAAATTPNPGAGTDSATADPAPKQPASALEARAEEFRALSEEEMEAELDRIEEEEASWYDDEEEEPATQPTSAAAVEAKLERVNQLRDEMDLDAARRLLYEVLVEGDEEQVKVARNILEQLDD